VNTCKDCIYFQPEELPEPFRGKVWEKKAVIPYYAENCTYLHEDGYGLCRGGGNKRPICGAVTLKNYKTDSPLCCHGDASAKYCTAFVPKYEQGELFKEKF
jgi:hypothetical protein